MDFGESKDMWYLVADRLRVNKLVHKIASWVASAVARRVELCDEAVVLPPALAAPLVLPHALAARAAVLAFGDELLDALPDESDERSESSESGDSGDFGDLGGSGSESGESGEISEISESDERGESSESDDSINSNGSGGSGESESGSESGESGESSQVGGSRIRLQDARIGSGDSGDESSQVGSRWQLPGGRTFAASYLLPRAEAELRQELQRLADAANNARGGQSSSSSGSRAI